MVVVSKCANCQNCDSVKSTDETKEQQLKQQGTTQSQGTFLKCGRCRHVPYCSKECQTEHWPIHRPVCSPNFEVFDTEANEEVLGAAAVSYDTTGTTTTASSSSSSSSASSNHHCRGMGIRALKPFQCGDEIFREAPIMRVPNNQAATSRQEAEELHKIHVYNVFSDLSLAKQKAIMSLSVCSQWLDQGDTGGKPTPHGVFQTNSYRLKGEEDGGLFLALARVNHSCRPNVNHIWRPDLNKTLVFAVRDIVIGDELLTCYGPSECLDTDGRRAFLWENFSFECMCDMCLEDNSVTGGDDRMRELHLLHDSIPALVHSGHYKDAMDVVHTCIGLLEEQGIGSGIFTLPLLKYGYQIAKMGLQDHELAQAFLLKELMATISCEGKGCPNAIRLSGMLQQG